jgi:hypothetical protein
VEGVICKIHGRWEEWFAKGDCANHSSHLLWAPRWIDRATQIEVSIVCMERLFSTWYVAYMEMDIRWEVQYIKRLSNTIQETIQEVSLRTDLESESWTKVPHLSWILLQHKILTANKLTKRGWPHNPVCKLCHTSPETLMHLCMDCPFTRAVWSHTTHRTPHNCNDKIYNNHLHALLMVGENVYGDLFTRNKGL